DRIDDLSFLRRIVVTELRAAVAGSDVWPVDLVERALAAAGRWLSSSDVFSAAEDALREADANVPGDETAPDRDTARAKRTADAHEAAAHLGLWLRHMASDFSAIEDLSARQA